MVTVILKPPAEGGNRSVPVRGAEGGLEESQGPGGGTWAPWQLRSQGNKGEEALAIVPALPGFLRELLLPRSLLLRQGAICPGSVALILAEGDRIFIWAWGHRGLWAWYRPVQTGTMTFVTPEAFED